MKNVLIFGSVYTELLTKVKELPKGNEDIAVLSQVQRVSGAGFICAYTFSHFGFPYQLICNTGLGVYGEYARSAASMKGVEMPETAEGIAGCFYRLMDQNNKEAFFYVPGSEFDWNEEAVNDIDPDEINAVILFGESLIGEGAEELAEYVSRLEKPVWFMPGDRVEEIDPELLENVIDLSDLIYADETAAYVLAGENDQDLFTCAKRIHQISNADIVILKDGEGLYAYDGEESCIAPEAAKIEAIQSASALFAALNAKIDLKNACVYAASYAARLHGSLKEEKMFSYEKRKLAELILHK